MNEYFTERSHTVMRLAEKSARSLKNEYLGTEHILLALVEERAGVAGNVLRNAGLDLQRLTEIITTIVHTPDVDVSEGSIPRTPRVRQAVKFAQAELKQLNHKYIGTEHLLLGLLRVTDGIALQALLMLGIKPNELRREVFLLLGHLDLADDLDV